MESFIIIYLLEMPVGKLALCEISMHIAGLLYLFPFHLDSPQYIKTIKI